MYHATDGTFMMALMPIYTFYIVFIETELLNQSNGIEQKLNVKVLGRQYLINENLKGLRYRIAKCAYIAQKIKSKSKNPHIKNVSNTQANLNCKSGNALENTEISITLSDSLIRCVDCKSRRRRFQRSRNDTTAGTRRRCLHRGAACTGERKSSRTVALCSWFAGDLTWGR